MTEIWILEGFAEHHPQTLASPLRAPPARHRLRVAAPAVVFGLGDESGPDRIEVDVSRDRKQGLLAVLDEDALVAAFP